MEIQENKSRERKRAGIIIAGVAAGALLLSGGTFALWNAAGTFDAASVTNGNLAVSIKQAGIKTLYKSTDGSMAVDTPMTPEEFANFRMVPGDKVSLQVPVKLIAEGDNLYAKLSLNTEAAFDLDGSFVKIKGQIYKGSIDSPGTIDDANKLGSEVTLVDGAQTKDFNWYVRSAKAATQTLQNPNTMTVIPAFTAPDTGGLDLVLQLSIELPSETGREQDLTDPGNPVWVDDKNTDGVTVKTDLSKMSLNLIQVRKSSLPV